LKQRIICKGLAVAVILLFIGVGINPAIAIVQKEVIQVSTINPDETRYLANFTMDFGENITNNKIDYKVDYGRSYGDWTINVRMKFRCPENLKILVSYEYFAVLDNFDLGDVFTFCDVRDSLAIVNGSNPPDIDIDYSQYVMGGYQHYFRLILKIQAILNVYEFIDGEWVHIDRDYIYNETKDYFSFNRVRPSERTKTSENDDCNLCPKFSNLKIDKNVGDFSPICGILKLLGLSLLLRANILSLIFLSEKLHFLHDTIFADILQSYIELRLGSIYFIIKYFATNQLNCDWIISL
jgi:hypothetical protein